MLVDMLMVRADTAAMVSIAVALHYNSIAGVAFLLFVCATGTGQEQTG